MTKLLILFLIVVLVVILVVSFILRALRRIVSPFFNPARGNTSVNELQKSEGEVLYKKDDVVVLKGEADRKKKE